MQRLTERGVVRRLITEFSARLYPPGSELPPGDDAADVAVEGKVVVKVDGFAASNSKLPWMSWRDFGWKAATAAVSDLVAKGAKPVALLASVGSPSAEAALEMSRGVAEAAEFYGASFAGGDTNACSGDSWVDVVAVGSATKLVARSNCEPGDVIYATGRFGHVAAALHAHASGVDVAKEFPELVEATRRPTARVEFLRLLELCPRVTASIDCSDGLAETLYQLAEASGVSLELDALPPAHFGAARYAAERGLDASDFVLYGGEEFEVIFAARLGAVECVEGVLRRLGVPYTRLGRAKGGPPEIALKEKRIERKGWNHFAEVRA